MTGRREEGTARGLVSQTSLLGRAAPASRSLGGGGGDPRETWPLAWLLVGLMVGGALGQLVVIFALLFHHDDAPGVTR